MRGKIIRAILVALLECNGQPMPEEALITAVQIACRMERFTESDVTDHMKTLSSEGYISGATDELTKERTWTLTDKGTHKARQLR